MDEIITRVLNQIGDNELLEKLLLLSKSDLNSLLLKLYQEQGKTVTPVDLLKSFHKNRFTVPSDICPINYHIWNLISSNLMNTCFGSNTITTFSIS